MNYELILQQTSVFDAVIKSLKHPEDKISFSKSLGMLNRLYVTAAPEDNVRLHILQDYAQYLQHSILETLGDEEWRIISGELIDDADYDCPYYKTFLHKYVDKIKWDILSRRYVIPESIIREFSDKVDWSAVSSQELSFDFVKEFSVVLDWDVISSERVLDEDFIEFFQDRVNWSLISEFQRLSESFIEEFKHKVDFQKLLRSESEPSKTFIANLLTHAYSE